MQIGYEASGSREAHLNCASLWFKAVIQLI